MTILDDRVSKIRHKNTGVKSDYVAIKPGNKVCTLDHVTTGDDDVPMVLHDTIDRYFSPDCVLLMEPLDDYVDRVFADHTVLTVAYNETLMKATIVYVGTSEPHYQAPIKNEVEETLRHWPSWFRRMYKLGITVFGGSFFLYALCAYLVSSQ